MVCQDNFWQIHDYLFEHQKALDDDHLLKYTERVGLDTNKFNEDENRKRFVLKR